MGLLDIRTLTDLEPLAPGALAHAKCYVYRRDSDALTAIYDEPELKNMRANPLVADAQGLFAPCYAIASTYRLVVRDRRGRVLCLGDLATTEPESDLGVVRGFASLADMLANQDLAYEAAEGRRQIAEGALVSVAQGGFTYAVAPVAETGPTLSTAAGVKLRARPRDGRFPVEAFGADPTGQTDSAPAFALAEAAARASVFRAKVTAGEGQFRLDSTVTFTDVDFEGAGRTRTVIRGAMTDGSACLFFHGDGNDFSLKGFSVWASDMPDFAGYLAGTDDAQNATGIRIGSGAGTPEGLNYGTRKMIQDVGVSGFAKGWDITGFILRGLNVWATLCDLGFDLNEINDSYIDVTIENCRKGFDLDICNGSSLKVLEEGGVEQSGYTASTIDNVEGLHLLAPYFERNVSEPVLVIGGEAQCVGVTMTGARVSVAGVAGISDMNVAPIRLDRVDGFAFEGAPSTGDRHSLIATTANTRNLRVNATTLSDSIVQEQHGQLAPARNLFPNCHFDAWFNGWPRVDVVRGALTRETARVRTGQNAVRLTCDAEQTSAANFGFVFNDGHVAARLAGKRATLFAWVWIPDAPEWDANDATGQTNLCYLGLYASGTGGGTANSTSHHTVRGAWNLLCVEQDIPADTSLVGCYVNLLVPGGSTGSEYIVLDAMYLVDGTGHEHKVINGQIADCSNFAMFGQSTQSSANAAPSDPDMVYNRGDVIWNDAPAAGGSMGWVCTAAGSGATATFRSFGPIA